MASEPPSSPGVPGSGGAPVQPAEGTPDVPLVWLLDPEHHTLAAEVDRLAGDVELVTLLALSNYEGPDWEYFATELAKYGMAVFGGWMYTGKIFAVSKKRGYGLISPGRPFTRDEIEELSGETIAKALRHFRTDVLMKNRWDSRKGATLRTYFIGQCLIRFANVYRRWLEDETRERNAIRTGDLDLLIDALGASGENVSALVADRAVIEDALAQVRDPRVVVAMHMSARDRPQAEIAQLLGVTTKAVERMLSNEQGRQMKRRGSA